MDRFWNFTQPANDSDRRPRSRSGSFLRLRRTAAPSGWTHIACCASLTAGSLIS